MSESYSAPEPQDVVQQGQQLQPTQLSNAPTVNAAGENLQCQWVGCGERCVSPEALYEHVCERHVGRKSTNNLNLTCQWGQCRTTTVKRDHITSHIRVHVPLKPHKCEFCGKAFKRPQDLKKHVKTHADDSVIMQSPGPNNGQRAPPQQGGMMYNEKTPQYYAQAMPAQDYGQHPGNQYYQPQPQGQHPGYGPVSYYPGPQPQTYDYQRRKEGFDALDQFFGEVKRRQFDPINYQNVTRRLFELQGLQLPLITQQPVTSIPAYQPVSATGGGYDQADPIQSYSLPPMGNAKTREDLTSIDQILEQMQATIYENDTHLAQAGVAQPGLAYVAYQTGNSPTSTTLPSTHAQSAGVPRPHQNSLSGTESASTPGLTPPSSSQSYTSGQSPMTGHAAPSSGAMYPNLPAGDMGYQGGNGATLGGSYDNDDPRRRYSGGMLQRAQPGKDNRDGSVTPPAAAINKKTAAKGKKKGSTEESAIDPALSGEAGTPAGKGEVSKEEAERQTAWVENMRLIEWMREMIKRKLETAQFDENGVEVKPDSGDVEMGGTDEETKKDEERLYPVLEAVKAA